MTWITLAVFRGLPDTPPGMVRITATLGGKRAADNPRRVYLAPEADKPAPGDPICAEWRILEE